MENMYHVFPMFDFITHETTGEDCPCGPTVEMVMDDDGATVGWVLVHHGLDRRLAE